MTNFQVEVNGTLATNLIDVNYDKTEGGDVGQALITVMNSDANRTLFASGADVVIKREDPSNPGTYEKEWVGEVIGTPSNANRRNATLEVEAETRIGHLEYGKVGRPFIQVDSGDIVRRALNQTVEPETATVFVTTGSDASDWSSNANVFELADISEKSLNEFGSDLLYADFKEGNSDDWYIRNTSVGSTVVPGRRILKIEMRALINNRGNVFDVELEVRDYDGVNYVWEVPVPGYAGFETYELNPEEATYGDGELSTDGAVELRVSNTGGLPEDRALVVDFIRTTPFRTNARSTTITTGAVEQTGRVITRRLDGSILEVAQNLSVEDGAVIFVDNDNVLHYETAGDTTVAPGLDITDDGSTAVVDADVDRDYDVRNRVTVQGAGDKQSTFEDTGSIGFYNTEAPKEEPITDTSIQTDDGLEARARGFLSDNAWEDTAMSFTIASAKFKDVGVGQAIDVDWPPENIFGTFVVSSVGTTPEGYVTIGMTGNTSS
jgi:hypothetical protein